MAQTNKQTIQFFRNASIITSQGTYGSVREAAIATAENEAKKDIVKDGEAIIVRYQEGDDVKSLIAIAHKVGGTSGATIFDLDHNAYTAHATALASHVASSEADIDKLQKALGSNLSSITFNGGETTVVTALDDLKRALDAGVAAAKSEVVTAVAGGHVTVTSSVTSGEGEDGHVVYTINEDDIASANLLGTTSDTTTDNTAFGFIAKEATVRENADSNLDARLDVIEGEGEGSVKRALADAKTYTDDEINNLDSNITADNGKFITSLDIQGGKITASTKGNLASSGKTININDFNIEVNIDETTIVKDRNGVLSVASAALTQYVGSDAIAVGNADDDNNKAISLTISSDDKFLSVKSEGNKGLIAKVGLKKLTPEQLTTAGLGENVKDAYQLVDKDGDKVEGSDYIEIYKDSAVEDVHIGVATDKEKAWDADAKQLKDSAVSEDPQKLYITYVYADGTKEVVRVDFSSFIAEAEMGDGMKVVDHKVTLDIADGSEFIGWTAADASGHKQLTVTGINTAINNKVAALSASTIGESGKFIETVKQENGVVAVSAVSFVSAIADAYAANEGVVAPSAKAVRDAIDGAVASVVGTCESGFTSLCDAKNWATIAENAINCIHGALGIGDGETCLPSNWKENTAYSSATDVVGALKTLDASIKSADSNAVKTVIVNGKTGTTTNNVATVTIGAENVKVTNYVSATSAANIVVTDNINQALGKLEYKVNHAADDSLNSIEELKNGGNNVGAITVSTKDDKKQIVSVNVDGATIKINAQDKLYVDVIDGGTF